MLRDDGRLVATSRFAARFVNLDDNEAERSRGYVRRHWRYRESTGRAGDLLERAKSHALCISGMAFQDAWNIDLERLRRCCVHVVTPGKKLVPFCAYYMTGSTGRRLLDLIDHG